ncbi:TetR/AcrR family transcriptional regulator [Paenibacillus radicis (ex Xue et al. 2023)]|uniref:TetR/AcrR family transcriptional regulator n=1 Tax=Paenibacillus radicis (ex Xue et al. 2023) TaxID=2972489 RepID=A0ABT1YKM5_9BACL|nr:TetR/AcrR family transcriptional regulator [Paenibacillus radicis (ex Xue et al. 2023)]MCR8633726.1 TetR/AcrR family transcriptional regulator [Paenibacillus radicis (ex Xue et al. 2023)]
MDEVNHLRIVQAAAELFNAKGYRNVTLSELAARLGMSKKTLYLYFSGKEEIAEAVLEQTMQAIACKVAEGAERKGNPIQILEDTFAAIKQEIIKLNPVFLEDIQKYIPGMWKRLEDFRAGQLLFIEGLLNQAQQLGLIRDLNPKLVSAIMLQSIQTFVRPDFAAKHGVAMVEVADTLFSLFTKGLRKENNE